MRHEVRHAAASREQHDALTSLLGQYIDAVKVAVRSRAELFSLEAQRATQSATRMAVLAGTLLIVGITAWLLLVTTVVLGMAAAGVPLLLALVIVLALHVVAALVTIRRMKALGEDFQFIATRRSLRDGIVKWNPRERAPAGFPDVQRSAAGASSATAPSSPTARSSASVPTGTPGDVAATRVAAGSAQGRAFAAEVAHAEK